MKEGFYTEGYSVIEIDNNCWNKKIVRYQCHYGDVIYLTPERCEIFFQSWLYLENYEQA